MNYLKQCFLILILAFTTTVFAQKPEPINSTYLNEYGISPKVLDIAASSLLQDGSFNQNIELEYLINGETKKYNIQVIYDPAFEYGKDVRVVLNKSEYSKKEIKKITTEVSNMHHFSRMSDHYLYDEKTLKKIKDEGDEVVLEYYYRKNDIEPYLKHIKKLKGNIYIKNGELDKIVVTNYKRLKKKMSEFEYTGKFSKPENASGYIVNSTEQSYQQTSNNTTDEVKAISLTTSHRTPDGTELNWDEKEANRQSISADTKDTISVKLGWKLPLLGKPATKLGYSLPRPIGINVFTHFQDQTMQFTGMSIGMNNDPLVSLNDAFDLDNSTIRASGYVAMVKADVWVLPFLNIMAIVGKGENRIDGNWPLDKDVKQKLIALGSLIGVDPEDIPNGIELGGDLSANMAGLGATLAGGIGDWNANVSYQFMATSTPSANTTTIAHVWMPMIGYMLPFGMNLMAGAQGQFYDTKVAGFVELDDGQQLNYNVDFQPVRWNAVLGIYMGFAKHWEIAIQSGFGKRKSTTAVFGYRF